MKKWRAACAKCGWSAGGWSSLSLSGMSDLIGYLETARRTHARGGCDGEIRMETESD